MLYFFPDSLDMISRSFDMRNETWEMGRERYHDDSFAHEIFPTPPYDGILLSRAQGDRLGSGSRFSEDLRDLLRDAGVRSFYRLDARDETRHLKTMGDCGAFSSVSATVAGTIEFYETCGFDFGIALDRMIRDYAPELDHDLFGWASARPDLHDLREENLALAENFLHSTQRSRCRFSPIGVAHGWSPLSYADSVRQLQAMGYTYIALGALVQRSTEEVLDILRAVDAIRHPHTRLHLLGVSRVEGIARFASLGVASFDSTKPLKLATHDDKEHYLAPGGGSYAALRVPQLGGSLQSLDLCGAFDTGLAIDRQYLREYHETFARMMIEAWETSPAFAPMVMGSLQAVDHLTETDHTIMRPYYAATLNDRPWETCDCAICTDARAHMHLYRGQERHKRRAFHNLHVFYRHLQTLLAGSPDTIRFTCHSAPLVRVPASAPVTTSCEDDPGDDGFLDDTDYVAAPPWAERPQSFLRWFTRAGFLLRHVQVASDGELRVAKTFIDADSHDEIDPTWEYRTRKHDSSIFSYEMLADHETVRHPQLLGILNSIWEQLNDDPDLVDVADRTDLWDLPAGSNYTWVQRAVYQQGTRIILQGSTPEVEIGETQIEVQFTYGQTLWYDAHGNRIEDRTLADWLDAAWRSRPLNADLQCASSSSPLAPVAKPKPAPSSSRSMTSVEAQTTLLDANGLLDAA